MTPPAFDIRTNPPGKILVRGVNWLGDAVMSTPALLRLREAAPGTRITLLTHKKLAGLWDGHPALDAVMTFGADESLWSVARRLKAEQFGASLILPNSARSALESRLAGIPRRIGYGGQWRRWLLTDSVPSRAGAVKMRKRSKAGVRWSLFAARFRASPARSTNRETSSPDLRPPSLPLDGGEGRGEEVSSIQVSTEQTFPQERLSPEAHHIHQYLHLVAAIGADPAPLAPRLFIAPEAIAAALAKFGIAPSSNASPLAGLNAGAEYGPAKRWPHDRFAAAALELQRRTNCRWLIFGGRGDAEVAGEIAAWLQSVAKAHATATHVESRQFVWNLAGQTSLRELGALLASCRVLLTNDTGPMHLAAAAGTPVVVPFGSTSPGLTGPGLPGDPRHALLRSGAPCSPCFRRECPVDLRCMTGITVEQVVAEVEARLGCSVAAD